MFERIAKEQLDEMANHAEKLRAMTGRFDRQCPSCGGFCKKSGCERANDPPDDLARLKEIEKAARNLIAQKGRHNTETAYKRLAALLTPNVKVRGCGDE